jgi:hypothetical protein
VNEYASRTRTRSRLWSIRDWRGEAAEIAGDGVGRMEAVPEDVQDSNRVREGPAHDVAIPLNCAPEQMERIACYRLSATLRLQISLLAFLVHGLQ